MLESESSAATSSWLRRLLVRGAGAEIRRRLGTCDSFSTFVAALVLARVAGIMDEVPVAGMSRFKLISCFGASGLAKRVSGLLVLPHSTVTILAEI